LAAVGGTVVKGILLTHAHLDHVQARDALRPAFEAFTARPRSPELCGDVEWV